MRLLVVTVGSLGDVLPFLSIAVEMQRAGHRVEFCTNPRLGWLVEAAGVAFHPIGSTRDAERAEAHPDLWHPIRGFGVLWRYLAAPALRPTFDRIAWHLEADGDLPLTVLCSPLALGARVARERWGFQLITAYTAPMNVRSVDDPMFLGAWQVPRWIPRWARWGMWWALDRWKLHPLVQPTLLKWRHELGLAAIRGSVFGDWMHDSDRRLALFPPWFASMASSTVGPVEQCDFPHWDTADTLEAGVEAFLTGGAPPVVIYPGSGARWVRPFVQVALEVCRSLGHRVIILTNHTSELPDLDISKEIHRRHLAFDRLLPCARMVIHHGGIGTCAQALRANCLQLILPSAYDQFDNGVRIIELGCGLSFPDWQEMDNFAAVIVKAVKNYKPTSTLVENREPLLTAVGAISR